jgi:hypothetical protein
MKRDKRNRKIIEKIESLLSDGEWHGLYDILELTECGKNTIKWMMGRINVERKKVRKQNIEGTYYRLKRS